MNKLFIAIAALIGTIIGAGFLAIPYVVMKSGFSIGIIHLIVLGSAICLTMLYLGEVTLRSSGNHQLAGYAEKYLGKKGKMLMLLAIAFGLYAALLAYLIGEGESLSFIFFNNSNYTIYFAIAFWLIMSIISYFGIKALEEGDFLGVSAVFLIIISIFVLFISKINLNNLTYTNPGNFFAPFGVILFAYLAFSIIPEIKRILNKEKTKMKASIISAYVLAFIIYALFTAIVIGYKGQNTPDIATLALGKPFILLGMITMFTSYLSLSIALIDTLRFDFKKSKLASWLYTISIPLTLFLILSLSKKAGFTTVLSIGGVISGGLTAILILLMFKKAKSSGDRKPEYSIPYSNILSWILIALFALGAVVEIVNLFN